MKARIRSSLFAIITIFSALLLVDCSEPINKKQASQVLKSAVEAGKKDGVKSCVDSLLDLDRLKKQAAAKGIKEAELLLYLSSDEGKAHVEKYGKKCKAAEKNKNKKKYKKYKKY